MEPDLRLEKRRLWWEKGKKSCKHIFHYPLLPFFCQVWINLGCQTVKISICWNHFHISCANVLQVFLASTAPARFPHFYHDNCIIKYFGAWNRLTVKLLCS